MTLLRLFYEFFKTGLFSVGGGMATLPFLSSMADSTGWFTRAQLMDMLAVSESTPGPIGVNMATYVGFTVSGIPGAIVATLGLISPSVIVILIIAAILKQFRSSRTVEGVLSGIRPASTALIAAACAGILPGVLLSPEEKAVADLALPGAVRWPALILFAALLVLTNFVKQVKKLHPLVLLALSAAVGIVFKFQGA